MKLIVTALAIVIHSSLSHALGDLLMTEHQRTQIDLMRSNGIVAAVSSSAKTVSVVKKRQSIRVDGFFFNNKDKKEEGVVWIDGKQVTKKDPKLNVLLKRLNEKDRTVLIRHKRAGTSMSLKPGQKIMLGDGQIKDAYEP